MNQTTEDLAYAAGLIDGEGSITICRAGKGYHNVRVSICMSDGIAVPWLHRTFDGNFYEQRTAKQPDRIYRRWEVYNKKAEVFLRLILPWLRVKRPQAELALKFRDTLIGEPWRRISPELHEQRCVAEQQMRDLKKQCIAA